MAFRQFNPLNVPEHWERYWTKYPQGMTILESLFEWVSQVDDMSTNLNEWNTYLKDFVDQFDSDLHGNVTEILSEWQKSGFLDVVIDAALQTQIDVLDAQSVKKGRNDNKNISSDNPFLEIISQGGAAGLHLTNSEGFTAPYIIGVGKDYAGLGIMLPNKANGSMIVGEQRDTVTSPSSYFGKFSQSSDFAPLFRFEQNTPTAETLLQLIASADASDTQSLIKVYNSVGESGNIKSKTGDIEWFRNIISHDRFGSGVAKFISKEGISDSGGSSSIQEPNAFKFFGYSGTSGTWFPFAIKRTVDSMSFQAGSPTTNKDTTSLTDIITIKNNKLGFFGGAAISKPTGVPKTIDAVYAALQNLGLIGV